MLICGISPWCGIMDGRGGGGGGPKNIAPDILLALFCCGALGGGDMAGGVAQLLLATVTRALACSFLAAFV